MNPKIIGEIDQEIKLETRGKTFDEVKAHSLGVYKALYDLLRQEYKVKSDYVDYLEKEVKMLKEIIND